MRYYLEDPKWIKEKTIPSLLRSIERTPKILGKSPKRIQDRSYSREYFRLGLLFLIINNHDEAVRQFRLALQYGLETFDSIYENSLRKEDVDGGTTEADCEDLFHYIIFSGQTGVLKEYSTKILKIPFYHPNRQMYWTYLKTQGYSKLTLKKKDLEEQVKYFKNDKGLPLDTDYPRGLSPIFKGVMDSEKELVLEGFERLLTFHHRTYKKLNELPYSREGCVIFALLELNNFHLCDSDINEKYWKYIPAYIRNIYNIK